MIVFINDKLNALLYNEMLWYEVVMTMPMRE
jgi:hypothetical protein